MSMELTVFGTPIIDDVLETVVKRLPSKKSRDVYIQDTKAFADFLAKRQITHVEDIDYAFMIDYQDALQTKQNGEPRAYTTINRMFTVARRILDVQMRQGKIARNPAEGIDGLKTSDRSSPHIALKDDQAKQFLASIDRTTKKGKQEYAVISILLRTGLRRSECAALKIGDLDQDSGHYIIRVTGKGGLKDIVKLPPDVKRYIQEWLDASGRQLTIDSPLFVSFDRGDHPTEQQISSKWIERTVKSHAAKIGLDFSPHSLRASFITLAQEKGATLTQTQYAARHKDPRQTEGYQRRKLNLDNNAVDKLSFLARE
jgi:integrase